MSGKTPLGLLEKLPLIPALAEPGIVMVVLVEAGKIDRRDLDWAVDWCFFLMRPTRLQPTKSIG
jgi:hypothetical protein